ncbi:MAG: TPM domain-containing protein [Gammaproteobacteria bacterium]|nr:TPM domain-containing protein [Gammaproteobacteria bacterium]
MSRSGRIFRHLRTPLWRTRRRFGPDVLAEIEEAIRTAEADHEGEIRFVIESSLDLPRLLAGQTPRQRALELFGQLGIWDTAGNSGVLLYVLAADCGVEIVADRGIAAHVPPAQWVAVCRQMEALFRAGQFGEGAVTGVRATGALLARHFPHAGEAADELPNRPLLL